MHWLIVEDSLEGREGHWFEYLSAFHQDLPLSGDEVVWLVSRKASAEVMNHFGALPILPESAFKKMSDGAPGWLRYGRVLIHAWQSFWTLRSFLKKEPQADLIFVPTVIIHHLIGWFCLIKTVLRKRKARVLLFFPGLPIQKNDTGVRLDGSPTARLMRFLFRHLASEIQSGKVILGVETHAMKSAASEVFGVPFTYFPHPVKLPPKALPTGERTGDLTLGCYGAARHEKGNDLLLAAIERYLKLYPESRVKFRLQWMEGFALPDGSQAIIPDALRVHPRVEIIKSLFKEGEYEACFSTTDALLLPYRKSSYNLRVSRLLLDALARGIPVVVTEGSTLEEQSALFGGALSCLDGDVESLIDSIRRMEQGFTALKVLAEQNKAAAQEHFSVRTFRSAASLTNLLPGFIDSKKTRYPCP